MNRTSGFLPPPYSKMFDQQIAVWSAIETQKQRFGVHVGFDINLTESMLPHDIRAIFSNLVKLGIIPRFFDYKQLTESEQLDFNLYSQQSLGSRKNHDYVINDGGIGFADVQDLYLTRLGDFRVIHQSVTHLGLELEPRLSSLLNIPTNMQFLNSPINSGANSSPALYSVYSGDYKNDPRKLCNCLTSAIHSFFENHKLSCEKVFQC
jgi:hypothetical protein